MLPVRAVWRMLAWCYGAFVALLRAIDRVFRWLAGVVGRVLLAPLRGVWRLLIGVGTLVVAAARVFLLPVRIARQLVVGVCRASSRLGALRSFAHARVPARRPDRRVDRERDRHCFRRDRDPRRLAVPPAVPVDGAPLPACQGCRSCDRPAVETWLAPRRSPRTRIRRPSPGCQAARPSRRDPAAARTSEGRNGRRPQRSSHRSRSP